MRKKFRLDQKHHFLSHSKYFKSVSFPDLGEFPDPAYYTGYDFHYP